MAARGLLNSSMAVGAGQDAVIRSAMPIAQQDASTQAQRAQFNAQQRSNVSTQNAGFVNEAGRFGADAKNQSSQFNATQQNQFALADKQQGFNLTNMSAQQKLELERMAKAQGFNIINLNTQNAFAERMQILQESGNGGKLVAINAAGDAQEAITTTGTGSGVRATSPALTGIPTAPTAEAATDTTQVATTAHVFAERTNAATLTNKTISGGTVNDAPIGGTTPAAGAFTTLSASKLFDGNSARFIGKAAPASGSGTEVIYNSSGAGIGTVQAYNRTDAAYLALRLAGDTVALSPKGSAVALVSSSGLAVTGVVTPEADNTRNLGTAALRWKEVFAGLSAINTSDAREKTSVRSLTPSEISAAKQLSKEIGAYQWLASVASKGDAAREHIGMTVQRVIEVMTENGLNAFNYGFICYDKWDDVIVEHPAIEAVAEVLASEGVEAVAAVEAKAAWTEKTQVAGDRYGFRMDQLNMFIARGFEARLAALEAKP